MEIVLKEFDPEMVNKTTEQIRFLMMHLIDYIEHETRDQILILVKIPSQIISVMIKDEWQTPQFYLIVMTGVFMFFIYLYTSIGKVRIAIPIIMAHMYSPVYLLLIIPEMLYYLLKYSRGKREVPYESSIKYQVHNAASMVGYLVVAAFAILMLCVTNNYVSVFHMAAGMVLMVTVFMVASTFQVITHKT